MAFNTWWGASFGPCANAVLSRVHAGSLYWNCCDRVSPRLPWSGFGDSGVGGAALDQVQGGGRGGQVALAKSCPEVAAACPGALGQAPTAVLMPCRSATSSMMSRIIPFRFQSLGV